MTLFLIFRRKRLTSSRQQINGLSRYIFFLFLRRRVTYYISVFGWHRYGSFCFARILHKIISYRMTCQFFTLRLRRTENLEKMSEKLTEREREREEGIQACGPLIIAALTILKFQSTNSFQAFYCLIQLRSWWKSVWRRINGRFYFNTFLRKRKGKVICWQKSCYSKFLIVEYFVYSITILYRRYWKVCVAIKNKASGRDTDCKIILALRVFAVGFSK